MAPEPPDPPPGLARPLGWHTVWREPGEEVSYLELATLPSAPACARRHTRATLHAWQICPETAETAELLVSEIVTNAVSASTHRPGQTTTDDPEDAEPISLTLRLLPGRITIEVFDNHPSPPILTDTGTDAESGRGLILIQALSKEWGHFFLPGGKVVHCTLCLPDASRT